MIYIYYIYIFTYCILFFYGSIEVADVRRAKNGGWTHPSWGFNPQRFVTDGGSPWWSHGLVFQVNLTPESMDFATKNGFFLYFFLISMRKYKIVYIFSLYVYTFIFPVFFSLRVRMWSRVRWVLLASFTSNHWNWLSSVKKGNVRFRWTPNKEIDLLFNCKNTIF
jgi:hypothetical protein